MIVQCVGRILDSASFSIRHENRWRKPLAKPKPKILVTPLSIVKFSLLLLMAILGCSSCEKVQSLLKKDEGKPPAKVAAATSAPAPAPATAVAPAAATTPQSHTGRAVSEISAGDFESFRQQTGKVVIIDFYADWCGPCRQLGPILEQIASSHQGQVLVGKVNVDKASAIAASEGVKGIPDVRIFRDGKEIDRFVGLPPEAEVRRRVESHIKVSPPPAPKPVEAAKAKTVPGKPNAEAEKPKPAAPPIQPMTKDWMPEGIKRR